MKKTILLSLLLVFLAKAGFAQNYPKYILPGNQITLDANKDTLWVITDKQMKRVLEAGKKLKITEEQLSICKEQKQLLEEKTAEQDSIIKLTKENRDYYKNLWQETNQKIEALAELNKRQSNYTKIAVIGGITASVAAFFAGLFLL